MRNVSEDYSLSVVLPVYERVSPHHLKEALESLYAQTYPPAEIVVVEDGPLSQHQYSVLDGFQSRTPPLKRVALPINSGAGPANHAGLLAATSPWIAKMDADDISLSNRFQVQVEALQAEDLDLVGSAMIEFIDDVSQMIGNRVMPEAQVDIERRVRINSPVNHPTVIYRRETALAAGGYKALPFLEDYDLIARMLSRGARMRNIPVPLLLFRSGVETINRRRSRQALIAELTLQRNLRSYGLIGRWRALRNVAVRCGFRVLPAKLVWRIYLARFLTRDNE